MKNMKANEIRKGFLMKNSKLSKISKYLIFVSPENKKMLLQYFKIQIES